MTDDQWLDAALATQAARPPRTIPAEVLWLATAAELGRRRRARRLRWFGAGFLATFLLGFGAGQLVPSRFRDTPAPAATTADAPSLGGLRQEFAETPDPVARGTLLRTAIGRYGDAATPWVWEVAGDGAQPEITRLIALEAVGGHVSAEALATLATPRTSLAVRYGVYQALGRSPDPEATAVLERLARLPDEAVVHAAIAAALRQRGVAATP